MRVCAFVWICVLSQGDFAAFETAVVALYNNILDDDETPEDVLAAAEAAAEAAGQLAFGLSNAGAAVTDLPPEAVVALEGYARQVLSTLAPYKQHVMPLDPSLPSVEQVAAAVETIISHTAVAQAAIRVVSAMDTLAQDVAAAGSDAAAAAAAAANAAASIMSATGAARDVLSASVRRTAVCVRGSSVTAPPCAGAVGAVAHAAGVLAQSLPSAAALAGDVAAAEHAEALADSLHSLAAHARSARAALGDAGGNTGGLVNHTAWPLAAAHAAAVTSSLLQTGPTAFTDALSSAAAAAVTDVQAALRRLGAANVPAPVVEALVEVESVAVLVAGGTALLADATAAVQSAATSLSTAVAAGDVSGFATAVATAAARLHTVVAPFMDMGARHVSRTAAALDSVTTSVSDAVDTLLTDGSIDPDHATAVYLVYPSDWLQLEEIQAALAEARTAWAQAAGQGHPALVPRANASHVVSATLRLAQALRGINMSQHPPHCVNDVTLINQTVFVTDEATGETRLGWKMIENVTTTCTAYVSVPTFLGVSVLAELVDAVLPSTRFVALQLQVLPGAAAVYAAAIRLYDAASIVAAVVDLPTSLEELPPFVRAAATATATAVARIRASIASGTAAVGPGATTLMADAAAGLEAAVAPHASTAVGATASQTASAIALSWSAAMQQLLLVLPTVTTSWTDDDYRAFTQAASDLAAAARDVEADLGAEDAVVGAVAQVSQVLQLFGVDQVVGGKSFVELLEKVEFGAKQLLTWLDMYDDVAGDLGLPSSSRRRRRRLSIGSKLKAKGEKVLKWVQTKVLTDKFACVLAPVAVIGLTIADDVQYRLGNNTGSLDAATQALLTSVQDDLRDLSGSLRDAPAATLAGLGEQVLLRLKGNAEKVNATLNDAGGDLEKFIPAATLTTFRRKLNRMHTVIVSALHSGVLVRVLWFDRMYQLVGTLGNGMSGAITAATAPTSALPAAATVVRSAAHATAVSLAQEVGRHVARTKTGAKLNAELPGLAAAAATVVTREVDATLTRIAAQQMQPSPPAPATLTAVLRLQFGLQWLAATAGDQQQVPDDQWDWACNWTLPWTTSAGGLPVPVSQRLHALAEVTAAWRQARRLAAAARPGSSDAGVLHNLTRAPAALRRLVDVAELVPLAAADADMLQLVNDLLFAADVTDALVPLLAVQLHRADVTDVLAGAVDGLQASVTQLQAALTQRRMRSSLFDVATRTPAVATSLAAMATPLPTRLDALSAALTGLTAALQSPQLMLPGGGAALMWLEELPRDQATGLGDAARALLTADAALTDADRAVLPAATTTPLRRAAASLRRQASVRALAVRVTRFRWFLQTAAGVSDLQRAAQGAVTASPPLAPSAVLSTLGPALADTSSGLLQRQAAFAAANTTGLRYLAAAATTLSRHLTRTADAAGGLAAFPTDDRRWARDVNGSLVRLVAGLASLREAVDVDADVDVETAAEEVAAALVALAGHMSQAHADDRMAFVLPERVGINSTTWQWRCVVDGLASALPDPTAQRALQRFGDVLDRVARVVGAGEAIVSEVEAAQGQPLSRFVGTTLPRILNNVTDVMLPVTGRSASDILARLNASLPVVVAAEAALVEDARLPGYGAAMDPMKAALAAMANAPNVSAAIMGGASVDALVSALDALSSATVTIPTSSHAQAAQLVPAVSFDDLLDDMDDAPVALMRHGKLLTEERPGGGGTATVSQRLAVVPTALVLDTVELTRAGAALAGVEQAAAVIQAALAAGGPGIVSSEFTTNFSAALDAVSPSLLHLMAQDHLVAAAVEAFLDTEAPLLRAAAAEFEVLAPRVEGAAGVAVAAATVALILDGPLPFDAADEADMERLFDALADLAAAWTRVGSVLPSLVACDAAAPAATRVVRDVVTMLPVTPTTRVLRRAATALRAATRTIAAVAELRTAVTAVAGAPSFVSAVERLTDVVDAAQALLAASPPDAEAAVAAFTAAADTVLAATPASPSDTDVAAAARGVLDVLTATQHRLLPFFGKPQLLRLRGAVSTLQSDLPAPSAFGASAAGLIAMSTLASTTSDVDFAVSWEVMALQLGALEWAVARGQELVRVGDAVSVVAPPLATGLSGVAAATAAVLTNRTLLWRDGLALAGRPNVTRDSAVARRFVATTPFGGAAAADVEAGFDALQAAAGLTIDAVAAVPSATLAAVGAGGQAALTALVQACLDVQALREQALASPPPVLVPHATVSTIVVAAATAVRLGAAADAVVPGVADELLGLARAVPVFGAASRVARVWEGVWNVVDTAHGVAAALSVLSTLPGQPLETVANTLATSGRPLLVDAIASTMRRLRDGAAARARTCATTVITDAVSTPSGSHALVTSLVAALTNLRDALDAVPSTATLETWRQSNVDAVEPLVVAALAAIDAVGTDAGVAADMDNIECFNDLGHVLPQLDVHLFNRRAMLQLWRAVHSLDAATDTVALGASLGDIPTPLSPVDLVGDVGTRVANWSAVRHTRAVRDVTAVRTDMLGAPADRDAAMAAMVSSLDALDTELAGATATLRAAGDRGEDVEHVIRLRHHLAAVRTPLLNATSPLWVDPTGFHRDAVRVKALMRKLPDDLGAPVDAAVTEMGEHLALLPVPTSVIAALMQALADSVCSLLAAQAVVDDTAALVTMPVMDMVKVGVPAVAASVKDVVACIKDLRVSVDDSGLPAAASGFNSLKHTARAQAYPDTRRRRRLLDADTQAALLAIADAASAAYSAVQQLVTSSTPPTRADIVAARDAVRALDALIATGSMHAGAEAVLDEAKVVTARLGVEASLRWLVLAASDVGAAVVTRLAHVLDVAASLIDSIQVLANTPLQDLIHVLPPLLRKHQEEVAAGAAPRLVAELQGLTNAATFTTAAQSAVHQLDSPDMSPEFAAPQQLALRMVLAAMQNVDVVPVTEASLATPPADAVVAVADLYSAAVAWQRTPALPAGDVAVMTDAGVLDTVAGAFAALQPRPGVDKELLLLARLTTAARIAEDLATVHALVTSGADPATVRRLATRALEALADLVLEEVAEEAVAVVGTVSDFLANSMTNTLPDLSGLLGRLDQVVAFTHKVQGFRDNVLPAVDAATQKLTDAGGRVADFVADAAQNKFDVALDTVRTRGAGILRVMERVDWFLGKAENLCETADNITAIAEGHVRAARETLERLVNDTVEAVNDMVDKGLDKYDELITKGVDWVTAKTDILIDRIDVFVAKKFGPKMTALLGRVRQVCCCLLLRACGWVLVLRCMCVCARAVCRVPCIGVPLLSRSLLVCMQSNRAFGSFYHAVSTWVLPDR